jgi:F420-non-reducing hydrogenase iron-sulfur subunit
LNRSEATRIVLEVQGIDPDRFGIEWVSSAEAPRFAEVVTKFTERIRRIGPNPILRRQAAAPAAPAAARAR